MRTAIFVSLLVGWVGFVGPVQGQPSDTRGDAASPDQVATTTGLRPRKAVIFVNNNAGVAYNDKVPVLESQVASRLASSDFLVISREDVQKALKVYPTAPAQRGNQDQNSESNRNTLGSLADRLLSDNTSALRLAQNLSADFILMVTLNTMEANESHYKDERLEFTNIEYVLQTNYKVLDGLNGGAIAGEDLEFKKRFKSSPSLKRNDANIVNDLLRLAATKIALSFTEKARGFAKPMVVEKVTIAITCGLRDPEGSEITLPDIYVTEQNRVVGTGSNLAVRVSASIEIDGILRGTTPAFIKLAPGTHKLRLLREGCKPYEATILAEEGLSLTPTLDLSDEGYSRWKDVRAFLSKLRNEQKLTDAEVKVLEGHGQFLRQSKYSVDVKSDVKVDTKEGIKFNVRKSLY